MIRLIVIGCVVFLLGGCSALTRSADDLETQNYFPDIREGRTLFNPKRIREASL